MIDITETERVALAEFAKTYGHQWKAYLKAAWLSYKHNGKHMGGADTGTLRVIRNQRGMRWLEKVRTADLQPHAPLPAVATIRAEFLDDAGRLDHNGEYPDVATMLQDAQGRTVAITGVEPAATWQGMTNAEHLADCERLERERKEREALQPPSFFSWWGENLDAFPTFESANDAYRVAFAPQLQDDRLVEMSTRRLANMLQLLTEHPNGDAGCMALAVRIRAELARRA